MDRHAAARSGTGIAVWVPVLPGDGTCLAPGTALSSRHQAGQLTRHRGWHSQDHRLRPGAGLRGNGGRTRRAAGRIDPLGRTSDCPADHLDRSTRPRCPHTGFTDIFSLGQCQNRVMPAGEPTTRYSQQSTVGLYDGCGFLAPGKLYSLSGRIAELPRSACAEYGSKRNNRLHFSDRDI